MIQIWILPVLSVETHSCLSLTWRSETCEDLAGRTLMSLYKVNQHLLQKCLLRTSQHTSSDGVSLYFSFVLSTDFSWRAVHQWTRQWLHCTRIQQVWTQGHHLCRRPVLQIHCLPLHPWSWFRTLLKDKGKGWSLTNRNLNLMSSMTGYIFFFIFKETINHNSRYYHPCRASAEAAVSWSTDGPQC